MSPFTSRQLWLSRHQAGLNPHTLYSSYAPDPTSPPLHLVVLLYFQQHTLKTQTTEHPRSTPSSSSSSSSSTRCQAKQKTHNLICQLHSNYFLRCVCVCVCAIKQQQRRPQLCLQ